MQHLNSSFFILLFIALSPLLSPGQPVPAKTFTLREAQDYAIKNSYPVKASLLDRDEAKWKIKETASYGLPQVNGNANYSNFIKQPVSLIPAQFFGGKPGEYKEIVFGTEQNAKLELTAGQLIFDGSYFVGLQAAQVYSRLSEQNLQKTETDVKENVARAYYTILTAGENARILAANKKNFEKILSDTKAIFNNGFIEEQSVDQMQLLLSNITIALDNAQRQLEVAYNLLKFQMGIEIGEKISISDNLEALLLNAGDSASLSHQDVTENIEYKMILSRERLMFLNQRLELSKSLPRLSSFFSYQYNAFRNEFNFFGNEKWFPTTVWGINLQIPVFSGFMRISKLQQARLELEKTKWMKKQVEQGLTLKIESAKADYVAALDRNKSEKVNLALSEKIRNKTLAKFNEGMTTSLDLAQAENQYMSTQGNYINSIVQLLNAKTTLDKAVGNLK